MLVPAQDHYAPRVASAKQSKRALALYDQIKDATGDLPAAVRGATIRRIVADTDMSLSTVQRHVKHYNQHGLEGLMRKQPSNAGKRRCAISMKFDKVFIGRGYSPELLPQLSDFLDQTLKGLWKGRAADSGENDVANLASFLLWEKCEELKVPMELELCKLGIQRVRKHRRYSIVNTRDTDAKAFRNSLPCIVRDWASLAPMALVVADVKHLDVLVTRENGAKAYPKMIGFMDGGTGRIFTYFVLCPERRSITQKLVIEAFIAMCNEPSWGLPRQLYLDNGSEFGGLDRIVPSIALLNGKCGREIIHAQPYNAQAKPIEPLFARLDRYCFGSMPGYTGGDRVNKKTQNDGKEPDAWEGTFESFVSVAGGLMEYYHQRHIGGQWGNCSPNEIFQAKIDGGWRPILADKRALALAFCDRKTVALRKDGVRHKSITFWHPEFAFMPGQTKIELLLPYREGVPPIAMLSTGPALLSENMPYLANDLAGAAASQARKQDYKRMVGRMDKEVDAIDPIKAKLRMAESAEKPQIPGRTRFLDQGATIHDLYGTARLIEQTPETETNSDDAAAARRQKEKARTERLLRARNHANK